MTTSINNPVASLEAIRYTDWYKRRGIRRLDDLKNIKLINDEAFELPRDSIVHYLSTSPTDIGIHVNNFMIRSNEAFKGIEHVTAYSTQEGSPIKLAMDPMVLARKYKTANRDIRPIVKFDSIDRNPENVVIVNYAILNHLYKYRPTYLSTYYKFANTVNTLIDKINELDELSKRQHFIKLDVPDELPTLVQFKAVSEKLSSSTLTAFNRQSTLFIAELYKWISDDREDSLFSKLKPEALKKVNLVFNESGKSSILNLGNLDAWRKSAESPEGMFTPVQLNVVFLNYVKKLVDLRFLGKEDTQGQVGDDDVSAAELETATVDVDDEPEYDEDGELIEPEDEPGETVADYEDTFGTAVSSDLDSIADDSELNKSLLPQIKAKITTGEITEKQAKRYLKMSNESAKIANPYGGGKTIAEIEAEFDSKINKLSKTVIPDKPYVTDKSMLETRLPNIELDYIREKYRDDIVMSVFAIQRDGYIIKDYSIDTVKDVNNEIELHSIKVETIGGEQSTVNFKVPVIRDDGTFYIGGTTYFLRKGRRDVPIRKVKPWKIFLTSYQSKLPVIKSQKVVDNYAGWLRKVIAKMSKDPEHPLHVELELDVFDHLLKLPRAYAMVSKGISDLRVGNVKYTFNYKNAVKDYGEKIVQSFLKDGEMPIAMVNGLYQVINDSGIVRQTDGKRAGNVLGSFLDVFKIPESEQHKAPVDKVSITVIGKKVPIAALMAYRFGLENLINALKLTVRRVPKGQRLNMEVDEYAVRFANDSLVLKRDEYVGQLVIGSLNMAKDQIKLFELEDFNTRDEAWGELLQRMGYGPRVYREFDSLYNNWLDPLTVQALKTLKEPTSFRPLLVRACELMSTEYHPKEMAGSGFMTKGYERIAGFVYKNLTDSIRTQKARQTVKKLDMNPNAVWEAIEKDTSKQIREDSNPSQNLKEMSNVTHGGTGGQTSRTMVRHKREFNEEDLGLMSEGGVDNGDVGVTAFLTYDPKIDNLLGMSSPEMPDIADAAKFQSTSLLISPFADRDDYFIVLPTRESGTVT